jgi:CDP-diacylglycerol--glycerol-3-phosphate 3-phosphatidyltransferase
VREALLDGTKRSALTLVTSAPQANSFFRGGRVKKWVPYFYRVFEEQLQRHANKQKRDLKLLEYARPGWTFHSKGVWTGDSGNREEYNCTLLGSSNYSERSFKRDSELNFYFYSLCPQFNTELHAEVDSHLQYTEDVTQKNFKRDGEMSYGIFTKLIARCLQSFL